MGRFVLCAQRHVRRRAVNLMSSQALVASSPVDSVGATDARWLLQGMLDEGRFKKGGFLTQGDCHAGKSLRGSNFPEIAG